MVNFQKVDATTVRSVRRVRTSKYSALVDEVRQMEPGDFLAVHPEDGEDLKKLRLGVSMVIRKDVLADWEAQNKMKLIRVTAGVDGAGEDVVIIECKATTPQEMQKRLELREKRSAAMKERRKKAGGSLRKKVKK